MFDTLYKNPNTDNFGTFVEAIDTNFSKIPNIINISFYGVVGDGTTDDTSAIQDAISECKSEGWGLSFETKIYKVTALLGDIANLHIEWNGAIFHVYDMDESRLLDCTGSLGILYDTTSDFYKGENIIHCTNATLLASLAKGSIIKIGNNTKASSDVDEDQLVGQVIKVKDIDAENGYIYTNEPINANYLTSNGSKIAKITPSYYRGNGLLCIKYFTGNYADRDGIRLSYIENLDLKIYCENARFASIKLDSCYNSEIKAIVHDCDHVNYGYGVLYVACSHLRIYGDYLGVRHAATSGSGVPADQYGLNYNISYINMTASGTANNSLFDTHAVSGDVRIINCKALGQIDLTDDTIIDWETDTTYTDGDYVRGSNGYVYEAKSDVPINKNPVEDQLTTYWAIYFGSQSGFDLEGGDNAYIIDCYAVNFPTALQLNGETPKNVYIQNFSSKNALYHISSNNSSICTNLYIDGKFENSVRSSVGTAAIRLAGEVTNLIFGKIITKNIPLITIPSADIPNKLYFSEIYQTWDVQETQVNNMTITEVITSVSIGKYYSKYAKNLLNTNDSATNLRIDIDSIDINSMNNTMIELLRPSDNIRIRGGNHLDQATTDALLSSTKTLSYLGVSGLSYLGSNVTNLTNVTSGQTYSYLYHSGNNFQSGFALTKTDTQAPSTTATSGSNI